MRHPNFDEFPKWMDYGFLLCQNENGYYSEIYDPDGEFVGNTEESIPDWDQAIISAYTFIAEKLEEANQTKS